MVKLCECECGHGHFRRDLEEEAPQPEMEKVKRRKTKTEIKPKLNIRRDNVSQKGMGNFASSKPALTKGSKNRTPDEYSENSTTKTIPGLCSSTIPLTLNMNLPKTKPKPKKQKANVPKPEKGNNSEEGWIKVSKSCHGKASQIYGLDMKNGDMLEVYQSEDDEDRASVEFDKLDQLYETSTEDCGKNEAYSEASTTEFSSSDSNFIFSKDALSDAQLEELLGNLVEEKLAEEIAKNKAFAEIRRLIDESISMGEAFEEERRNLLRESETIALANVEIREAAEAREAVLQKYINDLEKDLNSAEANRIAVLEENESLRRLVNILELDKDKARTETEDTVSKVVKMMKDKEEATLQMLEKGTISVMGYIDSLEKKMVAMSCSVDGLKRSEKFSKNRLLVDDKDNTLTLTSDNLIRREILTIAKEEAGLVNSKLDLLVNTVQNLQMSLTYLERKVTNYHGVGSEDQVVGNINDKILGLVNNCEGFEEMLRRMAAVQDKAFQQMESLDKDICLQAVQNKMLRSELEKFEEKMTALKVDKS